MDSFWATALALVFCSCNLVSIRIEMHRKFEVWFYTGALMGTYGVLLTVAGAYQWGHPPHTGLASYNAVFWAGIVLLAVGLTYTGLYWPWRKR